MHSRKERVIILRTIKHGESDLVIHALNRQGARVGFFAKCGAKSRKRFGGGVLEPTHYVEVSYRERPDVHADRLHTLEEAKLIQGFEGLRSEYERLKGALYFLTVMAKLSQEGTIDAQEMFDLLGNALRAAESSSDMQKLKLHFEIKVLGHQGILPQLAAADEWLRKPLKEHALLELNQPDLRQLEWDVHHGLEAYLHGMVY